MDRNTCEYFFLYLLLMRQLSCRVQAKVCVPTAAVDLADLSPFLNTRLLTFTAGCPPALISL